MGNLSTLLVAACAAATLGAAPLAARADAVDRVDVVVDPALPWIGFVNIFALPVVDGQDRGDYAGGTFLGTDIDRVPATFVPGMLVMGPNDRLAGGPPGDPFWWQPDGQGGYRANRILESNVYVDEGFGGAELSGKTVRFTGWTMGQDMPEGYAAYAWIRDFDPGYAQQRGQALVPLVAGQGFEVVMTTSVDGMVQYGFAVVGPNADPAGLLPQQTVTVSAVPEPATLALWLAGACAVFGASRRQRTG